MPSQQDDAGGNGSGLARRLHILLIQDDAAFLRALADALEREGFYVEACATAAHAQVMCRQMNFDLVVLDLLVGGVFADDLLGFIEPASDGGQPPAAVVMSPLKERDSQACLRPGAHVQGVLTRPKRVVDIASWSSRLAATLRGERRCHAC